MNVQVATIIKTNSTEATEMAKKTREVFREGGKDVVLVPHGVTDTFITILEEELVVSLQKTENGYKPIQLDEAKGFDSVAECKEYVRVVNKIAGLPRGLEPKIYKKINKKILNMRGEFTVDILVSLDSLLLLKWRY